MRTVVKLQPEHTSEEKILNPVGNKSRQPQRLAPRLAGLEGKTVGFLDNSKENADVFLAEVANALQQTHGVASVLFRRKVSAAVGGGEILPEIADICDAVVNAYGDCGSCTSWCVHDSTELEKRGIPTATINSEEFVVLGQSEAVSLNIPGLPIVTVPHPLGDASEEDMRAKARRAVANIVKVLTTDADALEAEYANKWLTEGQELRGQDLVCPI